MTSRLSSLLVRDGVVTVRRMEKAFQRQVLFGGGLDTILLEMNETTEQRLLQYLSMATGLPPATARELEGADARAAARCSRDLSDRFSIVPLWSEGEALRVLTRDPVDLAALEILANELEVSIQPFVAAEFRYELAFDRVYGRPSDERFTRLGEASRLSAIPPAGRSSVVVESAATKSGSIPLPNQARAGVGLGSAEAAGRRAAPAATGAAPAAAGAAPPTSSLGPAGMAASAAPGTSWDADDETTAPDRRATDDPSAELTERIEGAVGSGPAAAPVDAGVDAGGGPAAARGGPAPRGGGVPPPHRRGADRGRRRPRSSIGRGACRKPGRARVPVGCDGTRGRGVAGRG
jgi:hypothetical protein